MPISIGVNQGIYSTLLFPTNIAVFTQVGVAIAVGIRTKNMQLRQAAFAALPGGIVGVTEPIIYGVNLPKVKPFVVAIVSAAIVGLFAGILGIESRTAGGLGVFGILSTLIEPRLESTVNPNGVTLLPSVNNLFTGEPNSIVLNTVLYGVILFAAVLISCGLGMAFYKERVLESKSIKKQNELLIKYYALVTNQNVEEVKNKLSNITSFTNDIFNQDIIEKMKLVEKDYASIIKTSSKLDSLIINNENKKLSISKTIKKLSKNLEITTSSKSEEYDFSVDINFKESEIESTKITGKLFNYEVDTQTDLNKSSFEKSISLFKEVQSEYGVNSNGYFLSLDFIGKKDSEVDELLGAVENKFIPKDELIDALKNRLPDIEVMISGRYIFEGLSEIVDLISEVKPIKHYFDEHVVARKDMKYSVPFLNMKSVEIYKVQDLESDSELLEISEENLNSNESYFFQKKAISILEKNNINYFKTFLLEVDGIFFENDKSIKKLMKKEDLALVSFNTNARNKNFEIDKTTIFNFLLDKNYMNNQISEVSNFLKLSSTKIPLEVYLKNNNFTKLGIIDNLEKNDFFKLNNSKIFVKKFYLELESEEILNKTLENFKNDNFCGYLTKLDIGSTVLIERMRDVLKKISDGNTKNPYLANYLFNTKLIELVEPENNLEYANMEFKFNLNEEQKRAVHKAINSKDIFLVQGPPGTGKTQLICEIISQLNKMNRKIVITSQNHEAIKNVLDRLPNNPDNSKVRFANKYQSSINNFSVDKVVENYYSSLLKTVNQNMDNFESKLDSLESYKNKIENLFLNSETFTKLNSEISKINNEIDKINEELSNVNLQYEKNKLNSTRQKDTLENIKIISYCLNKNIFEVTSSEDDVMKE
ncbi:hypothetical protein FQR65_LT16454 [Abscondita terminalis]|nr:hypothetical protein FQR65_LT16454 [Abscondita terminalis]